MKHTLIMVGGFVFIALSTVGDIPEAVDGARYVARLAGTVWNGITN